MNKLILLLTVMITFTAPVLSEAAPAEPFNGDVSGEGAVLMEQESGRILFSKNADTPMRIASITKIMTAILAVESGKLDEEVTVSSRAVHTEGSSIYLTEGEKISLEDLVYGLMLRSGNDAAVAIAEHVGGSVEGFVFMMNEKAAEVGMDNTVFANPHGLDDHEEHYSTAGDMARLTRYAMTDSSFREISGTATYRSETSQEQIRVFNNKNRLLTQLYKHSTGGKTGYTKRARRTLVSTAEKDGLELIAVTLDAPSDWHDHMNLFEWGFGNFANKTVVREGVIRNVEDPAYKDRLYAEYSFEYPLQEQESGEISQRLVLLRHNPERWEREGIPYPVGTVQVEMNGEIIGIVPLSYMNEKEAERRGFFQWLRNWLSFTGAAENG